MYVNLSDDFKRLDDKAEIKSFPTDTSGVEDLNSLNVQWEDINQVNLSITDMDTTEVITVSGANTCAAIAGTDMSTDSRRSCATVAPNILIGFESSRKRANNTSIAMETKTHDPTVASAAP